MKIPARTRLVDRGFAATFAAPVAIQASLIVSGILAARVLGVTDRGYLALLVLVPTILYQVGGLGFPVAVAYFVAKQPSNAAAIARRAIFPAVAQTAVTTAIHAVTVAVIVAAEPERVRDAAFSTLLFVPAAFMQQYGLVLLQGQRRFVSFNVLRVVPPVLYALMLSTAVAAGVRSLELITALFVASFAVGASVTLGYAIRGLDRGAVCRDVPSRARMARFGLSGLVGTSSPIEVFRADQALVALLLAPAALGIYTVGMAFTNLPVFLAQSIGMFAFPAVASRADGEARAVLWRLFGINLIACGAVVVLLEAGVSWLLPLFFGDAFAPAVSVARLLLVAAFLLSCRRVLSDAVRGAARPLFGSIAELIAWAVFVPGAVLARQHGAAGIAAAFVVATAASLAVLIALVVLDQRRGRTHIQELVTRAA